MGKNYSKNNTGKRNKNDFYQTPYSCTWQLLENEHFIRNFTVLDPACGKCAIIKILTKFNYKCLANDLCYGIDFLSDYYNYNKHSIDYIITNPPYSLAKYFIQKAKKVAKDKFAMFLPLNYLHGQNRYQENIYTDTDYPLVRVYVFTRYIMLSDSIREDGKYTTGMQAYAWYIWENIKSIQKPGSVKECPIIKWIDNNKYVLRKGV